MKFDYFNLLSNQKQAWKIFEIRFLFVAVVFDHLFVRVQSRAVDRAPLSRLIT